MTPSEILNQHKIIITQARVAMISALQASVSPLSENDMKQLMSHSYDRITFYRNIQTLVESGIIHKIVADNTIVKYALNCCEVGHKHSIEHAHFFCKKCHKVICMNQMNVPNYTLPEGFQFADCDVVIKGFCKNCNNKH